jgi:hypothetical protein
MKTIIQAIEDKHLFRPFLADSHDSLASWSQWMTALRALYGLPISKSKATRALIEQCTGRTELPATGFNTALFLTGRRSGKSRIAAIIGAQEAILSGRESNLSTGEHGIVLVVSPTRNQSRIVRDYLRAIFTVPLLAAEIERETSDGFELRNGTRVEILAGDWRSVRGYTLISAIVDEVCFFGYSEESKVKSDTELVRAIQPSLATTGGKLVCISSPYAQKGWSWSQFKKHFGNNAGTTLVWNCASRVMNSTLPQSIIDEAYAEDPASASAEYGGQFRDDIATFLPPDIIERCVVPGRKELSPDSRRTYSAFVDPSGGRSDSAALCIGHREGGTVVIDLIREYKSPHNPDHVVSLMVNELHRYHVNRVVGDSYSAEWCKTAFETRSIRYAKSTKNPWAKSPLAQEARPKSQLYLELLPILCSGGIELLDHPLLIQQLCGLERKTRSGGRDVVDHGPNGHDDICNTVAGLCVTCAQHKSRAGAVSTIATAHPKAKTAMARAWESLERANFHEQMVSQLHDDGLSDMRSVMRRCGRLF